MLTFKRLNETNVARTEETFHKIEDWSPTDWACAMGGECGEALNLVKKLRRLDGPSDPETVKRMQSLTKEQIIQGIGDELADIIIYADHLATRLGLSLEDCVISKFNKDSDRMVSSSYKL